MPYTADESRTPFVPGLFHLHCAMNDGCTPGDLNFIITAIIVHYTVLMGRRYTTMNDVVGALESAKAEYQRRVVAPYEDECIARNGDVYDSRAVRDGE